MTTSWQHSTGKHEHNTTRNDVKKELKEMVENGTVSWDTMKKL